MASSGSGGGVSVLMVAEKPSIAESIAKVLSNGKHHTERKAMNVHEFEGVFQGKKAHFKCTSVTGHVYSRDFPSDFQNWDAVDPADLFTAPTVQKETKSSTVNHLASQAKGATYLVLWLDCDKEGENICFEVLDVVWPKMKRLDGNQKSQYGYGSDAKQQQVFRAKFSAVAKPDIEKAMRSLSVPNENESISVDSRQELDLKIGVAFSRYQTKFFQGKYGDLDSNLISYGPCQTPTLGFCVDRHDQKQSFQPETFYTIQAEIKKQHQLIPLTWKRGRVFDHDVAKFFEQKVSSAGPLRVLSVKESQGRKKPPTPLNTVELLKLASKGLAMGPATAMSTAERLYLSGLVSYPRTESTRYPDSFDIQGTVKALNRGYYASSVSSLLQDKIHRPSGGVDMGDHPPITPVQFADPMSLGGDMGRLYDMIVCHFLGSVASDCIYQTTTITMEAGGETFSASGKRVVSPGFTQIITNQAVPDDQLPAFTEGEKIDIDSVKIKTGKTDPPGYLTESELIGLMEKNGIGTDASIATHINNIAQRNYVSIGAGRTLVPTRLGIVLVHGYHKIDPDLVRPRVRAEIERQCDLIAVGKAKKPEVLAHALRIFFMKFRYFVAAIDTMNELFEASFAPLGESGKPMSRCGKCRRFMKYVSKRPVRLYCPTCQETYNLPQNGTIKEFSGNSCPLDGFGLVQFSLGNSAKAMGKSYPVCPYCYNNPPFEGFNVMACNQCLHPSCTHSLKSNAVCACPEDECDGVLVLDAFSKPNFKMGCNVCNVIVKFTGTFHSVRRTKNKCDCGAFNVDVEFHKDHNPLENGKSKYEGCVVCDDFLHEYLDQQKGRMKHRDLTRGKGKRRGGKRGGRGGKLSKHEMLMSDDF